MKIRKACLQELPAIMDIYAGARQYMTDTGNPHQWVNGYPSRQLIENDLLGGHTMVCEDDGKILGVFALFRGPDPSYLRIEGGRWLNDLPYGVIHRIAAAKHRCGVASACFAYGIEIYGNLRIDTYKDNLPMQRSLLKNGFTYCGTIYLENGDPRMAYQKCSK